MNFMNRKMFAVGGSVTYADGRTVNFEPTEFEQQLNSLSDADLFALRNSADAGQVVFSPDLKSILDSITNKKSMPFTQNEGFKPASMRSVREDTGRVLKGVFGPLAGGLTRQMLSEEQLENRPFAQSIAEYDSPFFGEGVEGFQQAADRSGRTREELASILKPPVQDFEKEIEAINTTPVTSMETSDINQSGITGEGVSFTGDAQDLDERRRAYEQNLIGNDEFGNPIDDRPPLPEMPPSVRNEIDKQLQQITPIESLVDVDLTEGESRLQDLLKFDSSDVVIEDPTDLYRAPPPVVPKETTGIFGSDRFLDFIRNVGGELVRTGQMGEGLASGAAKAGEERAARDLLAEEEKREFDKAKKLLLFEAGLTNEGQFMDYKEANSIADAEEGVVTSLKNFQKSERTVQDLDAVFEDLKDPNAYGVTGWLSQSMTKIAVASGYKNIKDWKNLDSATRINATLDVLTQQSVRDVLGESGKTISNLDREIVAQIFGNLTVFTTEADIMRRLTRTRTQIIETMEADKSRLTRDLAYFPRTGTVSPIVTSRKDLIDRILGIDLPGLKTPGSYPSPGAESQSITDINYRAPGT
tara:strand:- start:3437 stop:5191 length:1755 start_codon:yes stop_codon:yes gene_type:complete